MEDTKSMTLGKRILYYRKRMGLTQDQLAERMNVTAQAVSKWEHDLSCPDVTTLPRLAEVFGISTDELLGLTSSQDTAREGVVEDTGLEEKKPQWTWDWSGFQWRSGRYLWAFFLIALGGTYLASHLLNLKANFWDILWPMSILFVGLQSFSIYNPFGIGCTLAGCYFLLEQLGVIENIISWPLVLGICLVLFGLTSILGTWKTPRRQKVRQHTQKVSGKENPTREYASREGYIRADFAFCSDRITVNEELFRGGSVDVAFGSLVLDLQGCKSAAPGCALDLEIAFGSCVLIVPRHLRIDLGEMDRAGSSNNTTGSPDPDAQAITLSGDFAFSSLKIQYV